MMGFQIELPVRRKWLYMSVGFLLLSILFAFLLGPSWVYGFSGMGLLCGGIGLGLSLTHRDLYPGWGLLGGVVGFHGVLIVVGLVLTSLFVNPLPDAALTLPPLKQVYKGVNPDFELRGPVGWEYIPLSSPNESGVRIRPSEKSHYMGVSEITVFVRHMEQAPASPEEFLNGMAASFSSNAGKDVKKKVFSFKTKRANLISGKRGVWSVLDLKRFWVSLRHVSLFGLKEKSYFCAISAAGLKSHSTLFEVLCLGLFEKLKIFPMQDK